MVPGTITLSPESVSEQSPITRLPDSLFCDSTVRSRDKADAQLQRVPARSFASAAFLFLRDMRLQDMPTQLRVQGAGARRASADRYIRLPAMDTDTLVEATARYARLVAGRVVLSLRCIGLPDSIANAQLPDRY